MNQIFYNHKSELMNKIENIIIIYIIYIAVDSCSNFWQVINILWQRKLGANVMDRRWSWSTLYRLQPLLVVISCLFLKTLCFQRRTIGPCWNFNFYRPIFVDQAIYLEKIVTNSFFIIPEVRFRNFGWVNNLWFSIEVMLEEMRIQSHTITLLLLYSLLNSSSLKEISSSLESLSES